MSRLTASTKQSLLQLGMPAGTEVARGRQYPAAAAGAAGSTAGCASIDHVLLGTGSTGLRLVRSVLKIASVTLTPKLDAQGRTRAECATFHGGQTWGPVALADVTRAGEFAQMAAVQILDDTSNSAQPPATCA